jgi:hypothetical protein
LDLNLLRPDILPATEDFWIHYPPVPEKSQMLKKQQNARFVVNSEEESSSEEDSEDGFAQERPAEVKWSHQGEVVQEPTIPEGADKTGGEWEFTDLTKDSVIHKNSSESGFSLFQK